jgi:hypothetical protein
MKGNGAWIHTDARMEYTYEINHPMHIVMRGWTKISLHHPNRHTNVSTEELELALEQELEIELELEQELVHMQILVNRGSFPAPSQKHLH